MTGVPSPLISDIGSVQFFCMVAVVAPSTAGKWSFQVCSTYFRQFAASVTLRTLPPSWERRLLSLPDSGLQGVKIGVPKYLLDLGCRRCGVTFTV